VKKYRLSGSGSISIGHALEAENLRFESSGSGNISAEEINARTFESNISGSGSGIIEYPGV
jgi:hypothetical protein